MIEINSITLIVVLLMVFASFCLYMAIKTGYLVYGVLGLPMAVALLLISVSHVPINQPETFPCIVIVNQEQELPCTITDDVLKDLIIVIT